MKDECLDPIIELSSKSKGKTPKLPCHLPLLNGAVHLASSPATLEAITILAPSPASSTSSLPSLLPTFKDCPSVMQCLQKLLSVLISRNELTHIDFDCIEYHKVQFLSSHFDHDVVFDLRPCRGSVHSSRARNMEGIDKRYNSHT